MSDLGHDITEKELKKVEDLISREYRQAAQELTAKMEKHYADFDRKDAEMKAKVDSGVITKQDYKNWRVGQLAIGKRWESVRDSMTDTLVNADRVAADIIRGNSIKAYGENMNYGTYEVEHGSKINTGFSLYDESTVRNLLKDDPKIIPLPKVDIPKDELWNRQKLTSAVTQGILQGESMSGIAKRLSEVAAMDSRAAIRNARTYTTAAENKGRIDSYERANDLGIETKKKWIATLDDRTRVEHRHLDNMVVAYDEDFEVDGYSISYPGDPAAEPEMIYNCRCTLVAEIANYDYKDERNDEKLGDMDYEEWKHAKDEEEEESESASVAPVESAAEVHVAFGNSERFLEDYNMRDAEEFAQRMEAEDIEKFNAIFGEAEFTSGAGSHYDPLNNSIQLSDEEINNTTLFHESTHYFDFNQDYQITEDYGKFKYEIDENGDLTGRRTWVPDMVVIKEHAGFSEYIAHAWNHSEIDFEKREYLDSPRTLDRRNVENLLNLSGTYGWDKTPENLKKDMDNINAYLESKNISKTSDPDYVHLSDFLSAMTYDTNLGSLALGGHSYDYWVKSDSNIVTEITAGYNVLRAIGREDLIEIERELAPNLMKLIEEEWAKIW